MARKSNEARSLVSAEGAGAAALTHRRATRAKAAAKPDRAGAKNQAVAKEPACEHEEIAALAHSYWEARGRQGGSPEEDWFRAVEEVRRRRQTSNR